MTILENRIEESGFKKIWIAEKLEINTKTLRSWTKYENINQIIKFIELIEILDIQFIELIEDMKKNKVLD